MAMNREPFKRVPGGVNRDLLTEFEGHQQFLVNHAQQDCTYIVDANSRLRSHKQYGSRVMGAKLVARVPDIHYYVIWPAEFKKKYGFRKDASPEAQLLYRRFFLNKLNEPDFKHFRIDEGRL